MNAPYVAFTVSNVVTACWVTWLLRYLLNDELPPRGDLVSTVRMWNEVHSEERVPLVLWNGDVTP